MVFKRPTSGEPKTPLVNDPKTRMARPTRANLPKRSVEAYGPRMRFKVLGPVSVARDDGAIPLGGPKQRLVLAHLIVRANEFAPVDVLIDQVWGEEPPEAAKGTLHSYISHLRKAVGAERIGQRYVPVRRVRPDATSHGERQVLGRNDPLREGGTRKSRRNPG